MTNEVQRLLAKRGIDPERQLAYSDGHTPAWVRFDVFQALGIHPDPDYDTRDITAAYRRAAAHISPRNRRATRGVVPQFPTYHQLNIARDYLTAAPRRMNKAWNIHWYGPRGQNGWTSTWNAHARQGDAAVLLPDPNAQHPRQASAVSLGAINPWLGDLPPPRRRRLRRFLDVNQLTFADLRAWATPGFIIIGEVEEEANDYRYAVEARVDTDHEGPNGRLQVCRVKPYIGVGGGALTEGPGRRAGRISFHRTTLVGPFIGMNLIEVRAAVVAERTHPYP